MAYIPCLAHNIQLKKMKSMIIFELSLITIWKLSVHYYFGKPMKLDCLYKHKQFWQKYFLLFQHVVQHCWSRV